MEQNLQFAIKTYKKLSPVLSKRIEKFKSEEMDPDEMRTPEQEKEMIDRYHSEKNKTSYILALHKKEIIGRVVVLKRIITLNNKQIVLGGIGGVRTHIKWRRKGIARALSKKALEILKDEKCDVAFLCTRKEIFSLYEKLGFKPLDRQFTYTGRSGKVYFDWDGMLAPITSQSVFEEIMQDDKPFDLCGGNW